MGNIALTDVIPQDSLERQLYFIEKCKAYVADLQEKLGRPLTCCTQTFGCQMNARDSEKLLGILTEIGYVPVETEESDLWLYKTGTVRECQPACIRTSWPLKRLKKEKSAYDYRAVRLYDAGNTGC